VDVLLRIAAILFAVNGFGFGACAVYGIQSLASGNGVPTVMGFPSYGGGPFERRGIPSTVPLLAGFLVVCLLEVVAAWGMWTGQRWGAWLGLALLPFGAVYWWGFALPFGWVLRLGGSVLVLLRWDGLR
jgi:hypothetical protein